MIRAIPLGLAVIALAAGLVSVSCAATYKSPDGGVVITAPTIEVATSGVIGVIAKGGVHLEYSNPKEKTHMVADAKEVVATLSPKAGQKATDMSNTKQLDIKQVEMKSNVRLDYTGVNDAGVPFNVDSKCDNAIYTGSDQLARLAGNVEINYTDPSVFDGPCVVTGDKATVNTKKTLAEGEFRFRIESSPGVSKVEATPKPKPEAEAVPKPKTEPEKP